jgi:hypothetical protein
MNKTLWTLPQFNILKNPSIIGAIIKVQGINQDTKGSSAGDYWRLLMPGKTYKIKAIDPKTKKSTEFINITVPLYEGAYPTEAMRVDFKI